MRIGKRIMGPTTGLPLLEGRNFYIQAVVPAIAYACPVWFIAQGGGKLLENHQAKLATWQNRFLRLIEGAYLSTQVAFLEHELCVYSLDLELWRRSLLFLSKLRTKEVWKTISAARDAILAQPRCKLRPTKHRDVLYERALTTDTLYKHCSADFEQRWEKAKISQAAEHDIAKTFKKTLNASVDSGINKLALDAMTRRWETERATYANHPHPPATTKSTWNPKRLSIHAGLSRVESIALIRMRTEVIRLRNYLFKISSQASRASSTVRATLTRRPEPEFSSAYPHPSLLVRQATQSDCLPPVRRMQLAE